MPLTFDPHEPPPMSEQQMRSRIRQLETQRDEMLAIIADIATRNDLDMTARGTGECPFCFAPFHLDGTVAGDGVTHADDCPIARARRLIGGAP